MGGTVGKSMETSKWLWIASVVQADARHMANNALAELA
jgi:hypothetical protein